MRILEQQSVKCYLRSWSESGARNGFGDDSIGFLVATGEEGSEGLSLLERGTLTSHSLETRLERSQRVVTVVLMNRPGALPCYVATSLVREPIAR